MKYSGPDLPEMCLAQVRFGLSYPNHKSISRSISSASMRSVNGSVLYAKHTKPDANNKLAIIANIQSDID